jgi:anti-sigma factor RsiW
MLEFYQLGLAVSDVLKKDFKAQFNATRADAVSRTIEGSPVAAALVDWFESIQRRTSEMSAKALMQAVEHYRPEHAEAWPKSPKGFADALRRAAPSLRHMGIEAKSLGNIGGHIRWGVSERKLSKPSHEHHEVMGNTQSSHDVMTSMTSFENFSLASDADTQADPNPETF